MSQYPSTAHRFPAAVAAVAAPNAPAGTFLPGTKVQVGKHRVQIEKYLSEGGFAHVYVVRVPRANDASKYDIAVLKRVAVPDKDALANMRTEVETMKKLKGHKHIVTYIDSHASQLKGGGYEVFLLMEYCAGGGLIDFMNTRLQHRLTEPEILKIFSDVAEGVACMHYLKPPLLHRDLKVENVLISSKDPANRIFKLCDFGSTAPPRPAATTAAEGRLIEDDVQKHTTLQYRSPEMIDVYRKQPIDEKSDIWALGVLLYKLCYYTTPFEEVGQMAILNATFRYPPYPPFSDKTKRLIGWMLRENPKDRPNIYQVVKEVLSMRGRDCPLKDIYANRSHSEVRRNQQMPSTEPTASPPTVGLSHSPPVQQQFQAIPQVTPMRRGRPTAQPAITPKAGVSPIRSAGADPFAALDSTNVAVRSAAADELAAKFPSLDEFSLLHDRGSKFQFSSQNSPTIPQEPAKEVINKKVTEALADEAFGRVPQVDIKSLDAQPKPLQPTKQAYAQPASTIYQPSPQRITMVSTGVQTSPAPSPKPELHAVPPKGPTIWRVPSPGGLHHSRSLSGPRPSDSARRVAASLKPALPPPAQRPALLDSHRSKSQTATLTLPKSPASSRPSLEGSRPSAIDLSDPITRAKSANSRPRPTSVYIESDLDYLREKEREAARNRPPQPSPLIRTTSASNDVTPLDVNNEPKQIDSDVDFLRAMESDDSSALRKISSGSKHGKRNSINKLAGKFGDAFKRFENNTSSASMESASLNADPEISRPSSELRRELSPIPGSEATESVQGDDDLATEQQLSPEVRRELERQKLIEEERRVTQAAEDYRRQLAAKGDGKKAGGLTRASTIQNRVKNLLDESAKSPTIHRTAEGYGKYTRAAGEEKKAPPIARKPVSAIPPSSTAPTQLAALPIQKTRQPPPPRAKPKALRTGAQVEPQQQDDWEDEFSKRYPSLSGLEMVETSIETGASGMKIRDV